MHKKEVFAWSMYDLANTAFSALLVTFFFPLYINEKNICTLSDLPLSGLYDYLKDLAGSVSDNELTEHILSHVLKRLEYLQLLGLEYLSLSRESTTLSGGEAQRIKLATELSKTTNTNTVYLLDDDFDFLDTEHNEYYRWTQGFGQHDSYDWPKQIGRWRIHKWIRKILS